MFTRKNKILLVKSTIQIILVYTMLDRSKCTYKIEILLSLRNTKLFVNTNLMRNLYKSFLKLFSLTVDILSLIRIKYIKYFNCGRNVGFGL